MKASKFNENDPVLLTVRVRGGWERKVKGRFLQYTSAGRCKVVCELWPVAKILDANMVESRA